MNRKLLNGLLLLSVATGGVATFTSCKDTEDSLRNEVLVGQKTLGDQISAIRNVTDGEFRTNLEGYLNELVAQYSNGQLDQNTFKGLVLEVCNLMAEVDLLDGRLSYLEGLDLQGQIDDLSAYVYNDLTSRVDDLEDELGVVSDVANDAYNQAMTNKATIETLQEQLASYEEELDFIRQDICDLVQANQEILDRLDGIDGDIEGLREDLEGLRGQIESFNNDMAALYSFLANKFAQFITSIPVHQTYNPIFGTINLPIGVQTNMVAGYVFSSDHDLVFPSPTAENEYSHENPAINQAYPANQVTAQNLVNLLQGVPTFVVGMNGEVQRGEPAMAPGNNMGEIYLSINPKNVDYDGLQVQLVNSQDEAILTQSDLHVYADKETVLDFGATYTKANEGSALYRLPVRMEPNWADINQIAFEINNKGELASALKDAVKNHTISDFAHLGKLIYSHLDGFLPAYGVKVSWNDPQIDANGMVTSAQNAVYSNFNIAATVVRPLSFATGVDFGGTSYQLPTFDPISEYAQKIIDKIRNEINFEFENLGGYDHIHINPVNTNVNLTDIEIDLSGAPVVDEDSNVIGMIKDGTKIILTQTGMSDYTGPGAGQLDNLHQQLVDILADQNLTLEQVEGQVNNLIDKINGQLEDLNGQINDKLNDVLNKIENALSGKLRYADKLVDLYNKLAERVNTLLKDPNHYLQVMMAYNAGDGLHHLSTNVNAPTVFKQAGGDCIQLFATSYNAELIVPVFKKYVAITNVYYPWGVEAGMGASMLKRINERAGLNQVYEGAQQRIAIDASFNDLLPTDRNYIFEVYYTALDYHGRTSTQKYYFMIK